MPRETKCRVGSSAILISLLVLCSIVFGSVSAVGYRVIESMQQYVNGRLVTVNGRPTWPSNVTIHVYIPRDPQGSGAEGEVQAACQAWQAKLQSETNANLTFQYHIGQPAPPVGPPPPYVIEVNWTDEETTEEPGTATPISDVKPTSDPNVFERDGDVYRGQININRNRGPNNPYNANSIYNIALHEFGHIFGLDHKTADQDSDIMGETDISDPDKKHPIKDDDTRGLQDAYGRKDGSRVPEQPEPNKDDDDDEDDQGTGEACCAFECGGAFGCAMVSSEWECSYNYNGTLQPGTCETTTTAEQDQGVFGRCNGSEGTDCGACRSYIRGSHFTVSPQRVPPGGTVTYNARIKNEGAAITRTVATVILPPGSELEMMQASQAPFPSVHDGHVQWQGCIPPGRDIILTIAVRVPEDILDSTILTAALILDEAFTRETYAFVGHVEVGDTRATTTYRWTFTVTPTEIMAVSIPMPDPIQQGLEAAGVGSLRLIDGELPPLLALTGPPWTVSGVVISPGFLLPWMAATIQSTALYEGLLVGGGTSFRVLIEGTIVADFAPGSEPFDPPPAIDSDGDTVPDVDDVCPDVPGDPHFAGCPGYEDYEDTDGDGVSDLEDACPDLPGPINTGGCPS